MRGAEELAGGRGGGKREGGGVGGGAEGDQGERAGRRVGGEGTEAGDVREEGTGSEVESLRSWS